MGLHILKEPTLDRFTTSNFNENTPESYGTDPVSTPETPVQENQAGSPKWWESGFGALGTIGSAYFGSLRPRQYVRRDNTGLYMMIIAILIIGGLVVWAATKGKKK